MRTLAAGRPGTDRRQCVRPVAVAFGLLGLLASVPCGRLLAAACEPVRAMRPQSARPQPLPLTKEERRQLDDTVDRALVFLASHQNSDGSFQTVPVCAARGHQFVRDGLSLARISAGTGQVFQQHQCGHRLCSAVSRCRKRRNHPCESGAGIFLEPGGRLHARHLEYHAGRRLPVYRAASIPARRGGGRSGPARLAAAPVGREGCKKRRSFLRGISSFCPSKSSANREAGDTSTPTCGMIRIFPCRPG